MSEHFSKADIWEACCQSWRIWSITNWLHISAAGYERLPPFYKMKITLRFAQGCGVIYIELFALFHATVSRPCLLCSILKCFYCLKDLPLPSLLRLLPGCIKWCVLRNNPVLVAVFSLKLWSKLLVWTCTMHAHRGTCIACGLNMLKINIELKLHGFVITKDFTYRKYVALLPFSLLCSYSLRMCICTAVLIKRLKQLTP